jgi:hypothetical protein
MVCQWELGALLWLTRGFFGNIALVDGRVFGISFEEHSHNEFLKLVEWNPNREHCQVFLTIVPI